MSRTTVPICVRIPLTVLEQLDILRNRLDYGHFLLEENPRQKPLTRSDLVRQALNNLLDRKEQP